MDKEFSCQELISLYADLFHINFLAIIPSISIIDTSCGLLMLIVYTSQPKQN